MSSMTKPCVGLKNVVIARPDKLHVGNMASSTTVSQTAVHADAAEIKAIAKALSAIAPTRAVWKLAKKDLELVGVNSSDLNLGDNILLSDWVPQNDLLGHPNIKAFFTQGGTNSYNEVCNAFCMHGDMAPFITKNCASQASCH